MSERKLADMMPPLARLIGMRHIKAVNEKRDEPQHLYDQRQGGTAHNPAETIGGAEKTPQLVLVVAIGAVLLGCALLHWMHLVGARVC